MTRSGSGSSLATLVLSLALPLGCGSAKVLGGAEAGAADAGVAAETSDDAIKLVAEIALSGFDDDAQDLTVDDSGILIVTLKGHYSFDAQGTSLNSSGKAEGSPALGVDSSYKNWLGTVRGGLVVWYGWEIQAQILEGVTSGTALAVPPLGGNVFVTDAALSSVREHAETKLVREVAIPGMDLQGLAFSSAGALFALDAKGPRLLRLNAAFTAVDATLLLPTAGATPSGIHFFDGDLLYVCFKDAKRVSVFKLGPTILQRP